MASKNDALGDHLAAIGEATITPTFGEVEAAVGPLPQTARRDPVWWGATISGRYQHAYAIHWHRAGYCADCPDFAAEIATFRRVVP